MTLWMDALRNADQAAAQKLWNHFVSPLYDIRGPLFRELLAVELERQSPGDRLGQISAYRARFPDRIADVERLFEESSRASAPERSSASVPGYEIDGIVVEGRGAILEKLHNCRTAIFDKTGTPTYGRPSLTELLPARGFDRPLLLSLVASLERYSKNPLACAVLEAAQAEGAELREAAEVHRLRARACAAW